MSYFSEEFEPLDRDVGGAEDTEGSIAGELGETDILPETKPYKLVNKLVDVRGTSHPLYLDVVENRDLWGRAKINNGKIFLVDGWYRSSRRDIGSTDMGYFQEAFARRYPRSEGSVKEISENRLSLQCGVRRNSKLPEGTLARGIALHSTQVPEEIWSARVATDRFYPSLVHPYVRDGNETNPFDWAHERVSIAAGFARVMGLDNDFPIVACAYPYKKMAPLACNTAPERLSRPLVIDMDEKKREFLHVAEKKLGASCLPETLFFLLPRAEQIPWEIFDDKTTRAAFLHLPVWLENGLPIDRLGEVFDWSLGKIASAVESLRFSFTFMDLVYGGTERPWWFQEDRDIAGFFGNDADPALIEKIAQISGPAFFYAWPVYAAAGALLEKEFPELDEEAVSFSAEAAQWYGIGNTDRACNVVNLVRGILRLIPPADRKQIFDSLRRHAESMRVKDEILGRLQGTEVSMELPGVMNLMVNHGGEDQLACDKADGLVVKPEYLEFLKVPFALPHSVRAMLPPKISDAYEPKGLLGPSVITRMALPPSAEYTNQSLATLHPAAGIFRIYDRIRDECGIMRVDVANIYFTLYAGKLPDPFSPPPGFFRYLAEFFHLPVISKLSLEFLRDYDEDGSIMDIHRRESVKNYLLLSNLLDAWMLGFLTWEVLEDIFRFLIEDVPEPLIAKNEERLRESRDAESTVEQIQRWARQDAKSAWHGVQMQRLHSVFEIVNFLISMNWISGLHMLDAGRLREVLCPAVHAMLDSERSKSSDIERDLRAPLSFTDPAVYRELREGFEIFSRSGLFDEQRLLQILSEDDCDMERLVGITAGIQRCILFFRDIKNALERAEEKFLQSGQKEAFVCDLEDIRRTLGDVEALMREIPFIRSEHLDEFIRNSMVLYFQSCALGQMKDVKFDGSKTSPLLRTTHSVANMAASLYAAHEISSQVSYDVPFARAPQEGALAVTTTAHFDAMQQQVQSVYAGVREQMRELRRQHVGLLPIGAKVHVFHAVNPERLRFFSEAFGLGRSQFWLEPAGRCLILPAVPAAAELALFFQGLRAYRIIDSEFPELQITLPGRLDNDSCAVLGTTLLFSTTANPPYNEESFVTSHDDDTGRCIFIYDARGPLTQLPFMGSLAEKQKGRTDVLGRIDPADTALYQSVGTMLSHAEYGGPFGEFAAEFAQRNTEILRRYGLEDVLSAPWVKDPQIPKEDLGKHHFQALRKCTAAFDSCAREFQASGKQDGIIFEMRALVGWLQSRIREKQQEMMSDPAVCQELAILLE